MTTTRLPEINNGIRTNWIDFTTTGPGSALVSKCSSAIYIVPGNTIMLAFDPYFGRWIDPSVKCLASEHTSWWEQHSNGDVATDINLGPFQCPGGYTTATVTTIDVQSQYVGCCPSGYEFQNTLLTAGSVGQCKMSLIIDSKVTARVIRSGKWVETVTTIESAGVSLTGIHINGFQFSAASASVFPTITSTTLSAGVITSASTAPSNTDPANASASARVNGTGADLKPQTGRLTEGARIGIGIGCSLALVGIFCLLGAVFVMRRNRKASHGLKLSEQACGPIETWELRDSAPPYSEAVGIKEESLRSPVEMWVPLENRRSRQ